MKTKTEATSFGSITIDGLKFDHDVIIRLDGSIRKRKKKLSKKLYGTSHKISRAEAEFIYEERAQALIIGGGQFDQLRLSPPAMETNVEMRSNLFNTAEKRFNRQGNR